MPTLLQKHFKYKIQLHSRNAWKLKPENQLQHRIHPTKSLYHPQFIDILPHKQFRLNSTIFCEINLHTIARRWK